MAMKKSLFIFAAICAAAAVSCTPKELVIDTPEEKVEQNVKLIPITITASFESAKADMDGNVWTWQSGDKLAVFDGTAKREFSLDESAAGSAVAKFTGEVAEGFTSLTGVFPYSAAGDSYEAAVSIPAVQTVGSHQSADPLGLIAKAEGEKVSDTEYNFYFQSAVSLLKFKASAGATKIIIHTAAKDETIAGTSPSVTVDLGSAADGTKVFWAAVNPASYTGIHVFTLGSDGKYAHLVTDKTIDLSTSGKGKNLGSVNTVAAGGTEVAVIEDGDDLASYLGSATAPTLDAFIVNDLNLTGKTVATCASYANAFDGLWHTVGNWTSDGVALFGSIAASGAVRNLVIDASCKLTVPADAEKFGFVAGENAGTIENVTNNAAVGFAALSKGWKGAVCGENTGTLVNCINNGSVSYSGAPQTDGSLYVAGVAGRSSGEGAKADNCSNTGNISLVLTDVAAQSVYVSGVTGAANSNAKTLNCSNTGNVTVRVPSITTNGQAAGIVCYSGGEITECTNSGNISFFSETAEGKADGSVKGVGVAGIACYSGWNEGKTAQCSNSGAITLRAGYTLAQQTVGSATKYSSNVAGVIGHAYNCSIENCTNSGAVRSEFRGIDNAESVYNTTARQSVGGIVSSSWGNVTGCTNTGTVDVVWITAAHNAALAKNFVGQVGGISGGDYHSDQLSSSIIDCTNEGAVTIICDSSQSNNAFGGIVGWPGKENASGVNEVLNCVNKGDVTLDGYSKSRVGGISGGATKATGCKNYGKVYLKGGLTNCSVGGIIGFQNFFNVTGCESRGEVASDVKLAGAETSAAGGVGALVGALGNTAQVYSGCKVDCAVKVPEGSAASLLLGVIGQNKGVTTKLEVGTAEAPITVKGSFNGTALTASNYETYIRRPDFSLVNTNITFNVKYGD